MSIVLINLFDHFDVQLENCKNNDFILYFCSFVGCISSNGGGFYSSCNVDHLVSNCVFSSCTANVGRGGAFFIQKGNAFLNNVCTNNCNSELGADIIFWDPMITEASEYCINTVSGNNIQTVGSKNKFHVAYISASNIELKNINSSYHTVGTLSNSYSNGMCIAFKKQITFKYANYVNSVGGNGIIHIECVPIGTYSMQYINAINNKPQHGIFSAHLLDSCTIKVFQSNFIENTISSILHKVDGTFNLQFYFYDCIFSCSQLGSSEFYSNCEFNKNVIIYDTKNLKQCFINIQHTQANTKCQVSSLLYIFAIISQI